MPRRDDRPVDLHGIVLPDAVTGEPVDLGGLGTAGAVVTQQTCVGWLLLRAHGRKLSLLTVARGWS